MTDDVSSILTALASALPDAQVWRCTNPGPAAQHSLLVAPAALPDVLRWLRDAPELAYDFLSNLTGIDWPDPALAAKVVNVDGRDIESSGFLETVYHLYSTTRKAGPLVLRCRTADRDAAATLPSVVGVFRSAELQEREIFDLFGITFVGHPDLRRILMWDEFADHPMRKDYRAPDDYEYEPTPHDAVLEKARAHRQAAGSTEGGTHDA